VLDRALHDPAEEPAGLADASGPAPDLSLSACHPAITSGVSARSAKPPRYGPMCFAYTTEYVERVVGASCAAHTGVHTLCTNSWFGRGPDRARTYFVGSDIVLCSLEQSFTSVERSLVEMGEHQRLRETRLFFQHAREDDFRGTVEQITGRRVRGFMSATDTAQDLSCEIFYLEPAADAAAGATASVDE
jgi:uncharacterized protein YbcI